MIQLFVAASASEWTHSIHSLALAATLGGFFPSGAKLVLRRWLNCPG
jgi:hypothetical protein